MRRTLSQQFSKIVVSKPDLRNIWSIIHKIATEDSQFELDHATATEQKIYKQNPQMPTVTVQSVGSMTTESETDAIFDNDVIDLQKTVSLDFRYSNYRRGKSINVSLAESQWRTCSISVSGNDTGWVDATFAELKRIFDAIKPQSTTFDNYRGPIHAALAIAIGYSILLIWSHVVPTSTEKPPDWVLFLKLHPPLNYIPIVIISYLIGLLPAASVVNWVANLWPDIEFDFGPEHMKTKKNVRSRVGTIVVILVLPVLLIVLEHTLLN